MPSSPDLAMLRIDDFAPHLNTSFEIHLPDGRFVAATLVEAVANGIALPARGLKGREGQDLKARDGGGFTLQFVTPENSLPRQESISSSIRYSARLRSSWCPAGGGAAGLRLPRGVRIMRATGAGHAGAALQRIRS